MPALIKCKAPDSKRARVCSSICYNARRPACTCICEGLNHGKGYAEAVKLTRSKLSALLSRNIEISKEVSKMRLF